MGADDETAVSRVNDDGPPTELPPLTTPPAPATTPASHCSQGEYQGLMDDDGEIMNAANDGTTIDDAPTPASPSVPIAIRS
jgi:hypothetical protein